MSGPADAVPLPEGFAARMRDLLGGAEAAALLDALRAPARPGLRVHPARIDLEGLAATTGWRLDPLPWTADAATVDAGADRPGLHPLHEAGAYYLQEPSATLPAAALAPRPGARTIDLAAAPGGKATALAAALGGEGLLVANDVHPRRVGALARNLERLGARRTVVTNEAPARIAKRLPGGFDAVLLDAPCSGEGMFRKSEDARRDWSPDAVRASAARQDDLLDAAADLLAPGGRLVYSTCTFAPEENEARIAALLARRPELRPEPIDLPGLSPGRPEWVPGLAPADAEAVRAATARLWPHLGPGEGHFVARLRRDASAPAPPARRQRRARRAGRGSADVAPREARRAWEAFAADVLAPGALPETRGDDALALRGETLWCGTGLAGAEDLRTLRDGLPLGRWRKGRFEPSHTLAQALRPEEVGARLELTPGDPDLARYLAGEELDAAGDDAGDDGPRVVTVLGSPLGWIRRTGPRLRNLYPRGLRRR